MESEFNLATVCTTTTADIVAGVTTVPVTAMTGIGPGAYLWIYDASGTYTERFMVASIATLNITSDVTLAHAYASGSYVIRETYDLPCDFFHARSCRDVTQTDTDSTYGTFLKHYPNVRKFDYENPIWRTVGIPESYVMWGFDETQEPLAGGTFTTGTDTTTTLVKCATLPGRGTNYYTGWILTNITRLDQQRVTAFNDTTKALTLKAAITAQVPTDTFTLKKNLQQVFFDRMFDQVRNYLFRYFKTPAPLIGDTDLSPVPGIFVSEMLDLAMFKALRQDGRENKAMGYYQTGMAAIARAWDLWGVKDSFDSMGEWKFYDQDFAGSPDADPDRG